MSKLKVVLNWSGVGQLLKSEEMKAICKEKADEIAMRLGDGYETSGYTGETRVNASILAATPEAKQDNMDNNTLLKALR